MKIKKPTLPKVKMNMVVGKRQIVLQLWSWVWAVLCI